LEASSEFLESLEAAAPLAGLPTVSEPVTETMPASYALRIAVIYNEENTVWTWLSQLLASGSSDTKPPVIGYPDASNTQPSSMLLALRPWLQAAMRHLNETQLTTTSMAYALLAMLETNALDAYPDFKHICHGHADELKFWVKEYQRKTVKSLDVDLADKTNIPLSSGMQQALAALDPDEFAREPVWRWLHAAVNDANKFAELAQSAYFKASIAVAKHVLMPEYSVSLAMHDRETNSANGQYESVYIDSLESLKEKIVFNLVGPAVEELVFGKDRGKRVAITY